jgi:hypothetical protein
VDHAQIDKQLEDDRGIMERARVPLSTTSLLYLQTDCLARIAAALGHIQVTLDYIQMEIEHD